MHTDKPTIVSIDDIRYFLFIMEINILGKVFM